MDSNKGIVERTADLYQQFNSGVDMDLHLDIPQEFSKISEEPFISNALKKCKILFERNTYTARTTLARPGN